MRIFIGYDAREEIAASVCEFSIKKHWPDADVQLLSLDSPMVKDVYNRPYVTDHGQKIDCTDGRPFSTDFAFSRFLVPYLSDYTGWSLFCDCDFLFLESPAHLIQLQDQRKAVMCVQHSHHPPNIKKMDNQLQLNYERKNWSSLMMFNCGHPENRRLTPETVNTMPGSFLHQMRWLHQDRIGEIPERWNWLVGSSPTTTMEPPSEIAALHFTEGGPWFPGYENCDFAELWAAARKEMGQR